MALTGPRREEGRGKNLGWGSLSHVPRHLLSSWLDGPPFCSALRSCTHTRLCCRPRTLIEALQVGY